MMMKRVMNNHSLFLDNIYKISKFIRPFLILFNNQLKECDIIKVNMKTKIIKINEKNLEKIEEAKEVILGGDLVAFPTETVYGLGADGLNPESIKKIFLVKGRPQDNPLILHIADFKMLEDLTDDDLSRAKKLAYVFWPGPLTMVLKKSSIVPAEITAGLDTVAIRMPKNKIALEIIRRSGKPIAAPSANLSGRPSPTDGETCFEDLDGKIPLIIDGGKTDFGLESTVVDLSEDGVTILRPGAITLEMIREIFPEVKVDAGILNEGQVPKSPGQKYKHYAPKAESYLVDGSFEEKIAKIIDFLDKNKDKNVGLMASTELLADLNFLSLEKKDLGSNRDYKSIASLIFRGLRELDKKKVDIILVEAFPENGMGLAIMNRLKKSTANRYI